MRRITRDAILIKVLPIIVFQLTSFLSFAQSSGSIRGVVRENNNPVEFANVFVTLQDDTTKIVAGEVTNSLGEFLLNNLPFENYILNVQLVGFKGKQISVSITPANHSFDAGEIFIEPDALLLNPVEVNAFRNIIEKTDEGFVVKADENITQIGGTAADLLRNMPGVLVGADGEITIRGKSPLTLINGRISGITGVDRAAQLERIPASNIDRIEIINNPSAKYDADAEGGVINIVLKKNEDKGTNGAFAVGAGFGDRYRLNASMLLNHKTNRWNFGGAYDNWYTTRTRMVKGDRTNFDLPDKYYLTQRRFDERLIFYQNAKVTADYALNKKSNLNFEVLWAFPGEDNNETLKNTYEDSENNFTSSNQRHSNEIRRSHTLDLSLLYVKRFDDPDKLLSINLSNTFGNDKENTDITTQPLTEQDEELGEPFLQKTHTYQKTNLTNVAVDYAEPIANNGILETGYKFIFRYLNADFERANQVNGEIIVDPLNSNIFDYREQIHAIYAQYTGWTGQKEEPKWKYNFGLRAEQVWNNGETQNESDDFNNEYFNLFPSGNLFYFTPKRNNIKLSYSRRINRPGLGQLNPFTDITDSLNQRAGNPNLKPELIHSFELGYNYTLQKLSASIVGFYRIRKDAIFPYTILDENGVAFTQPLNFGNASTIGLETLVTYNPFEFWNINFSLSAFDLSIDDDGSTGESIATNRTSWYTKIINTFTVFRDSKLQVVGNYTSPTVIPQGESVAVYFVDLGFQQKIMKGKGRLGITITDLFNSQKYGVTIADSNFEFSRIFKQDTQALMFTFGYTFGTAFRENLMENKFKNE